MRPMGGGGEKGLALQHGFHMPLLRAGERLGQITHIGQPRRIIESAISLRQQHSIIPARTALGP